MSICPSDFLVSAKQLVADGSEIATRNAISRAYYAVFHQVRDVFPADREFAKGSCVGVHETYIDQLMQAETASNQRTIAVKLSSLKGKRNKADYDLGAELPAYMAMMQIRAAEEVFCLLQREEVHKGAETASDDPPECAVQPVAKTRPRLQRIR